MWPAPSAPTWSIFSVNEASTGRTASRTAGSPPTRRFNFPARACCTVRVIGASMNRPPAASTFAAICVVDPGSEVEQSTTTAPGFNAERTPSVPLNTASTCGDPVTHRMITSLAAATSRGVATPVAPRPTRSSTG